MKKEKYLWIVVALMVLPFLLLGIQCIHSFMRPHKQAPAAVCLSHLHSFGQALQIYVKLHDNHLPEGESWCDELQKAYSLLDQIAQCPARRQDRCEYGMNAAVAGWRLDKIVNSHEVVLLFETDGGWNVSGGPESITKEDRHHGRLLFLFCDGSARSVKWEELNQLNWTPQSLEETPASQ